MKKLSKLLSLLLVITMVFTAVVACTPSVSVTGLEIKTNATKTEFTVGQMFSSEGLEITKLMSDNTKVDAAANDYFVDSSKFNGSVAGTYTIDILLASDRTIKVSYDVVVANAIVPVTGITIPDAGAGISLNATRTRFKLEPTVLPANATNKSITYKSSNIGVATIDETGVVQLVGNGVSVITATTVSGAKSATINVTVQLTAGTYTFKDSMVTAPNTWNPHNWESNDDSYILGFNTIGMFEFALNSTKDGYDIVPEMATSMTDVSKSYAGTYGVPSTDNAGYVWRFKLNELAKWDNGAQIDANTYIYSMQQLLSPEMLNRRADTYYSGQGAIYGAKAYMFQGQSGQNNILDSAGAHYVAGISDDDGSLLTDVYFNWNNAGILGGGNAGITFADFYSWGGEDADMFIRDGVDLYQKWEAKFGSNGGLLVFGLDGYELAEFDELCTDIDYVLGNIINDYGSYFASKAAAEASITQGWAYEWFLCEIYSYESDVDWSRVGFKKIDNYTIDIVFVNPIVEEFYVVYTSGAIPLVYEPLYELCKIPAQVEGGQVKTTYCTNLETTIGYGPYMLTSWQLDKQFVLEKNPYWYGWTDGKHVGQFQTTAISVECRMTQSTALMAFRQGLLSNVEILPQDVPTFGSSSYTSILPESYTNKITLLSDYNALKARETATVNKTLMSYVDFRQALSLSLNRDEYAKQLSPVAVAGYGLINYMYVADYNTGALYRDEILAKLALVALYTDVGAQYNDLNSPYNWNNFLANYNKMVPGQDYTYGQWLDTQYESMTGQNIELARQLFVKAFEAAIANGDFKTGQTVVIDYKSGGAVPSANFQAHAALLQGYINAALAGTPYAGLVTLNVIGSVSQAQYWDDIRAGKVDIGVNSWGGAAFSPFTTINNCYLDNGQRHEYGLNTEVTQSIMLTIKIDGKELTYSLWQWGTSLAQDATQNGVTINYTNASYDTKVLIYSTCEYAWLSQYCSIPVQYQSRLFLDTAQVKYAADNYVQLVAYGGIRFMTYVYDDLEWANIVKAAGGIFDYTK